MQLPPLCTPLGVSWEDMPGEGDSGAQGHRDLRPGGWLDREPEQLISMTTSSGHGGRQTIKRRGEGGKKGRFSPALSSPGTEVPVMVLGSGPGRGQGRKAKCDPNSKAPRRETGAEVHAPSFRVGLDGQQHEHISGLLSP